MDSLSDVMSYCRGLDTDKVSERKKNAEKLRQLLERKSVVRTLDQNTDERLSGRNNSRLITWDDVFKAAVLYVRLETVALQKGKEPQSQTALLNKEKKKLEISGFFKYIVRTADKRGPRLKYQPLILHILEMLKDDYCCSAYGQDYSSVLLKDVLPVRKYWVDIRTDTWHDLLHQYFRLFLDPDCSMEHVVLARLIHVILAGASRQCDLHTKKVILFFTEVFKNIRQEKGSQVSEHLLMALNVFVRRIAPSARIQVCKLGEGIFLNLLYLWNNRPTDNIKDEIVEFMRVQLQAHHPGGAKCSESGELAVDRDLWMSHLRKLYELMYTDLQQMGGRNRFSSGTKEAVLKAAYVDLAADVCNQLFSDTSHTIEVTQLSLLQEGEGEGDHSTPRKKRRLESGWSVVRDTMYGTAGSCQLIPWLQLVTRLVEKYPSSIPEEELLPLLQCLHKMLNDCKKSEVLRHIFQSLVVMVNSYPAFQHITTATIVSTQSIWQSIWSSTLRSISSHQADAEGYQQFGFYLLAAMVDHKLIIPEKDVWNLFLPNVSSPSNASIHFLSVCLKSHDLPENHQPSILGSSSCVVKGSYPLRTHLLNWILPKREVSEPSLKQTRLDPSLASRVLTSLIVRNPQSFMADSCSQDKQDHATELEKLYLETTFNRALRIEKIFETVSSVTDKHDLPLMPCLMNTMKDIFDRECVYFQAISDIQVSTLHDSISCCSIVAKCLQNMLESGVTSPTAMADTGLELCLKTLLRQMSTLLSDYVKKEGTGSLLPVVTALRFLFPDPASHSLGGFVVAELLRSLLPGKFYDVLFDIAFSKMSRCNSNSNNSVQLGSLRRRRGSTDPRAGHMDRGRGRGDDLMDLDLDLDDAQNSLNNGREADDDEVDFEMGESQESDELNHSDMCSSLVSDDALPETQRLRLEVVRVLCACCNHERSVAQGDVPYRAEVETGFLKNKLEELFEENMFDPNRALDILVMETIIRNFTKKSHKVSDMDLENMLDAIRQAAKAQRRDQEVCCLLLELMTLLVPHLGDPDDLPSKVKKECREITLKLLSAFFKLREDGQYAAPVRLNIARCMQAFIQCDPGGGWSYLTMRREGEDTRESLCKEFPNCVLDGCHLTRSYVAEAVQCLFVIRGEKGLQPKPSSSQHEAFDLLYQNCTDLMEIKGKMSPERQHDERLSRTASVLSVLATVACTSPINEKKAVFAVCQLIKERDIEVEKVNKVFVRLSRRLGYEDMKQFVKSHLPFLLSQWLELEYQLQEFPARLLGCDTTLQFYRSHKDVIVPTLFMQGQTECIQSLSGELGESLVEVLKLCTPLIVVHILPLFAASKSGLVGGDKAVKKSLVLANKCYDCLVNELTNEVTDQIIHANLDMIVVNVLRCLHVTAHGVDTDTRCVPDPNPPSYSSDIVRSTLDYLTHSSAGNNRSLISVLAKTQSSLQKVLLELTSSLFLEHRVQEKRRILAMLQLFVEMLLPEFAEQLGGSWVFVLRDLIHRLIQVIADVQAHHRDVFESDAELRVSMTETCLEMLRSICSVALECCHEELGKYIDYIVSSVLKFLKQPGPLQEKCQSLLSLLLLENATLLREAIGRLDPLPEGQEYQDYRSVQNRLLKHQDSQTLAQKLERWVCVVQEKKTDTCVETLRCLADLISSSKRDLTCLMAGQDMEGQKVVCQIVSELLHLTQSSYHQVALQAASCLGVIGPVDLATISLPRRRPRPGLSECLAAYREEPICQNYCWIFHTLNQYLLEPGVHVVKTAGQVLRSILATRRGIEFSTDYKTRLTDRDYLFSYLHPFKSKKPSPVERTPLNMEHFLASVNTDSLWVPDHSDHTRWVTDITCALLRSTAVTDEVLCLLEPICRIKPEFCELVLPFLVHDVLMGGTEDMGHVISSRISFFFLAHCRSVHGQQAHSKSGSVCTNKDSIQTMLNVVQYLRQQERPRKGRKVLTPWDNNFWLDVNYLEIAQAALFCAAPFTAILYAEIWSNSQREEESRGSSSNRSQRLCQDSEDLRIDTLSSVTSSSVKLNIQELLLEAYESVSDPDGVYGCGAGRLADQTSRIKTYLHENRLEKAVVTYDIGMNKGKEEQEFGLLKTVQDFGADHLLALCLQSKLNSAQGVISPELEEIQYEAAWRTGQWNLEVPTRQQEVPCYHQSVYSALEALKDQQLSLAQSFIDTARQSTLHMIDTRPESCRSVYPVLSRLHSLYHLQQIVQALDSSDQDRMQTLLLSLNTEEEDKNEFEFVQPVMDVTLAALKILTNQKAPTNRDGLSVADTLRAQQYKMARFARKEGKYQVAERIVSELKQESDEPQLQLVIEEAKLYWARDEQNIAKHLIKSLISKLEKLQDESFEAVRLLPQALGVYGGWLAETRTENPGVILENYLEKTVELLDPSSTDDIVEAYMSLAQFVDTQYQNINNYMKSSTFEAKQALMRKAKMDAQSFRQHLSEKDSRYLRALDKQGEIDEREVEALTEDREMFLLKAVENYIKCLRAGDRHDLRIYRLTSLWFDNAASQEVNELINTSTGRSEERRERANFVPENNTSEIKSYKFLPLMYQLAARMTVKLNHCPLFQPTLAKILETACIDHPHHTVSVIMALAHANKDMELLLQGRSNKRTGRLSRTVSETDSQEEDRVQAAKALIDRLKKDGKVSQIVRNMEVLSVAYIQLANTNVDKFKNEKKPIPLPSTLMISQMKNLTAVALPTIETKLDPTGQYKNVVTIVGFEDTFRLAGGVNLPKILSIIGSDGVHRRQLVKGRDDLRQDAVMQQVFGMVNSLLEKNPETKKRNLRIRTYKVVPLSQRSGVLEWCEGTQPLGEYLIGSTSVKGAHTKYRPQDISAGQCREAFGKMRGEADLKKKRRVFQDVCDRFQPIFRHFFMERFADPAVWFEKRLAYSRSVATNSIIGYILGLGDRHVMNILIDKNSAELVHIDLGIAFEQGKILPTPETVPFRLTRDIVDGMGVTGVEGVFRRCCEKTMWVMHSNQECLLMILQVLLYDPLYAWSLSPQQALQIQRRGREDLDTSDLNTTTSETDLGQQTERSAESQENVNKMAERVLLRLQQKLQGIEDGIQLSVSGQVNNLIQEARDPNNLCRLFVGWQPYL